MITTYFLLQIASNKSRLKKSMFKKTNFLKRKLFRWERLYWFPNGGAVYPYTIIINSRMKYEMKPISRKERSRVAPKRWAKKYQEFPTSKFFSQILWNGNRSLLMAWIRSFLKIIRRGDLAIIQQKHTKTGLSCFTLANISEPEMTLGIPNAFGWKFRSHVRFSFSGLE